MKMTARCLPTSVSDAIGRDPLLLVFVFAGLLLFRAWRRRSGQFIHITFVTFHVAMLKSIINSTLINDGLFMK